jgi:hypothetical protein
MSTQVILSHNYLELFNLDITIGFGRMIWKNIFDKLVVINIYRGLPW